MVREKAPREEGGGREYTHLSSGQRTKRFAAAAWMRMIWVVTAWNDYHILPSPRILDSPRLAIVNGAVTCFREKKVDCRP